MRDDVQAIPAQAEARVATTRGARYMEQMFKHFEHKLPVTRTEGGGSIAFSIGTCVLTAEADALRLAVSVPTASDLEQLEGVVARHLVRFAFREEMTVSWTRQPT